MTPVFSEGNNWKRGGVVSSEQAMKPMIMNRKKHFLMEGDLMTKLNEVCLKLRLVAVRSY